MGEALLAPEDLADIEEFKQSRGVPDVAIERALSFMTSKQDKLLNQVVVGPREFIESPHFMNAGRVMWPVVLDELCELNNGMYNECLATGGIGAAKTTLGVYTQAYQLYLLSCYKNPHEMFELDPSSEIVFIFQSLKKEIAREIDYERFRAMCERAPYFRDIFPFDREIESQMRFPRRIAVKPVSGEATAAIGQNCISALIDEVNHMSVVERSKKAKGGEGRYDQALANYSALSRRRRTRFVQAGGVMPGILFLGGSRLYPGDFSDRKEKEREQEIRDKGSSPVYLYDKRVWEVKPKGSYCGDTFRLFVGDESRQPRKLLPKEKLPDTQKHLVMKVPTEFEIEFDKDVLEATREVAGRATAALRPFMINIELVNRCFGKVTSIFEEESVDFHGQTLHVNKAAIMHHMAPRFAHFDLGLVADCLGLVIGHLRGFRRVQRGGGMSELMPIIRIDGMLQIRPAAGTEIDFAKARKILYVLRDTCGMNIKWVTLDSWQSRDTIQILRRRGFITGETSMDKTTIPYDMTKSALYDGRVWAPEHEICQAELRGLEKNMEKGKVDHRVGFSKDVADALAGVIYGLTTRRVLWLKAGIPPSEIPEEILAQANKARIAKHEEDE